MSTYIFTDTIADFNEDLAKCFKDFDILPLSFSLDDDNYNNGVAQVRQRLQLVELRLIKRIAHRCWSIELEEE